MLSDLLAIAGNELRMGVRNQWVLLATLSLMAFAIVLGLLGAAPSGALKVDRLSMTVASLATLSVYLVPLLALLVSFDAIAGELDRNTLQLVLASPVSRPVVVIGKFLGQSAVVAIAVTLGYGLSGLIIGLGWHGMGQGVGALVRLILTSIALGTVYVAIGILASALTRQSSTAAALAVGIWLVSVVLYDLGLLGALVAGGETNFATHWFPWLLLANPADAFRVYNLAALDAGQSTVDVSGMFKALPYPALAGLACLALWALVANLLGMLIIRRVEP